MYEDINSLLDLVHEVADFINFANCFILPAAESLAAKLIMNSIIRIECFA